jgi:hypothetical protein
MDNTKFVGRFKSDTEANDFWFGLQNKPYYAEIIHNIKDMPSKEESQTFLNKVKINHDNELKELGEIKNSEIDMLKKELIEQKINWSNEKSLFELTNESQISQLKEQQKQIVKHLQETIDTADNRAEVVYITEKAEWSNKIILKTEELENLKLQFAEKQGQVTQLEKIHDILKEKQQSSASSLIGQAGEELVGQFLINCQLFEVEPTARTPGSGDYFINFNGDTKTILVEVKNYKTTVPNPEMQKFMKDVDSCNVIGGIFVSLKSKASSHHVEHKVHMSANDKPMIVIDNFANKKDSTLSEFRFAALLVQKIAEAKHNQSEDAFRQSLKELEDVATKFKEHLDTVSGYQKILSKLNEKMTKDISKFTHELHILVQNTTIVKNMPTKRGNNGMQDDANAERKVVKIQTYDDYPTPTTFPIVKQFGKISQ